MAAQRSVTPLSYRLSPVLDYTWRVGWRPTLGMLAIGLSLFVPGASAQTATSTRIIKIDGADVRVRTSGLERRLSGQPVIVLEAGFGSPLESWNPIFDALAQLAPVIAYDRFGLGQSGADPKTPTLTRNVETLHDVLNELAKPPYVLVGHSLGGVIIRGFGAIHSSETAGLVYLDPPDFETTRAERAELLTGEARVRALQPLDFSTIPSDAPSKMRTLYEQFTLEVRDDFPTARKWRQLSNVPVGVIVAARADYVPAGAEKLLRLNIRHKLEWTLGSPDSMFIVAGHTGHSVHWDDPQLVISMVNHVYKAAANKR
jgi:pimeloyl-ACP methyl ester carboxylesterase